MSIVTPLDADRWSYSLRDHPYRDFVAYIMCGIRSGFHVGFQFSSVVCQAAMGNMPSALQCVEKIDEFLAIECAAGRVLGPFNHSLVPMVHVNRLGAVPRSIPGKYRRIVNLKARA